MLKRVRQQILRITTRIKTVDLTTPKGRFMAAAALVTISVLIVSLSTLNPAGSNSPNGNRPGSGDLRYTSKGSPEVRSHQDRQQPKPGETNRPSLGPGASADPSEQAETEQQRLEREEQDRISRLSASDSFLLILHISLENYIKASDLAIAKGSTSYLDDAQNLKKLSQGLLRDLERIGEGRKMVWAKYGLEPDKEGLHRWNYSPLFQKSNLEILESSTKLDFEMNFKSRVSSSLEDLVRFVNGRDMPEDSDFDPLKRIILSDFAQVAESLALNK